MNLTDEEYGIIVWALVELGNSIASSNEDYFTTGQDIRRIIAKVQEQRKALDKQGTTC